MNIERVAQKVSNSLVGDYVLEDALEAIRNKDMENPKYWEAAACIVEPVLHEEDEDEFYEMLENDPENWVGFIKSIDERFGPIAEAVIEYGY